MAEADKSPETIGVVAGGGQFPFLVARGARDAGYRVAVLGLLDNADPEVAGEADVFDMVGLGKLGKQIKFFKSNGVKRMVMAGTVNKARARNMIPDMRAARALLSLPAKGDDAILRLYVSELEKAGLQVLGPHELVPDLLTPAGVLAGDPSDQTRADAAYGYRIAKEIGRLDIGQTVVIREGVVVAVEALEGTDETIRRGCGLAGQGCTVIKVLKPGQETRADLPSVGLDTVRLLCRLDAACLAVEAGASLFFDRDAALDEARANGLCVLGVDDSFLEQG